MSASLLRSVTAGIASQPVSGAVKPHRFRSRIINRVVSNECVDTELGMAGKSFPHCVGLIILLALRDCKVGLFAAKTVYRFSGGWREFNVSRRAWVPIQPADGTTWHSLLSL